MDLKIANDLIAHDQWRSSG